MTLLRAQVRELRRRASRGTPLAELAEAYGISRAAASQAVRGVTYRDVPGAVAPRGRGGHRTGAPASLVARARALLAEGKTAAEVARALRIPDRTVRDWRARPDYRGRS